MVDCSGSVFNARCSQGILSHVNSNEEYNKSPNKNCVKFGLLSTLYARFVWNFAARRYVQFSLNVRFLPSLQMNFGLPMLRHSRLQACKMPLSVDYIFCFITRLSLLSPTIPHYLSHISVAWWLLDSSPSAKIWNCKEMPKSTQSSKSVNTHTSNPRFPITKNQKLQNRRRVTEE